MSEVNMESELRQASNMVAKLPANSMLNNYVILSVPDAAHVSTLLAEAANRIAALQQQGEAVNELWCLHIQGPDDAHPAPSKTVAEYAAKLLNAMWLRKGDNDPVLNAVAAPWPHNAKSHAEGVNDFADNFLIPADGNPPKPVVSDAREALKIAHKHLDMDALKISHCNDAAKIEAALGVKS